MDECKALSDGSPRGAFAGHGRCARFVSCYVLDLLDDADIYATLAEAEVRPHRYCGATSSSKVP